MTMRWVKKHALVVTIAVLIVGALAPWWAPKAQDTLEWAGHLMLRPLNPGILVDGMMKIIPKYSTVNLPTCKEANAGSATSCRIVGSNNFMVGSIAPGWATNNGNPNDVVVTFGATQALPPACVAAYGSTGGYGYYLYGVTTTTTTATLKLGKDLHTLTPSVAEWSPGDTFTLICGGVS